MFMNYMQGGGGGVVQGGFRESEAPPPPPAKFSVLVLGLLMPCASIRAHSKKIVIIATGES